MLFSECSPRTRNDVESNTKATINVFRRGFTISVPDNSDFDTVRFEGHSVGTNAQSLNEFSQTQTQAVDGSWTYIDNHAELQYGNVINYRVLVTSKSRHVTYAIDQQAFTVTGNYIVALTFKY